MLVRVLLHFFLDFIVFGRGHIVEVELLGRAGLDLLDVVLECLVSVLEESNLILAVSDGRVEHIHTDGVTVLLKSVFSIVAGIDVVSLSLDLSVLVLSVAVRSLNSAELLLVPSGYFRLFGNFVREGDGVVVSVLDGLLGLSVVVVDLVLEVDEDIQSVLVVSDLKVQLIPVVSPGNSVFVTSDLKLLLPGSQ